MVGLLEYRVVSAPALYADLSDNAVECTAEIRETMPTPHPRLEVLQRRGRRRAAQRREISALIPRRKNTQSRCVRTPPGGTAADIEIAVCGDPEPIGGKSHPPRLMGLARSGPLEIA